MRVKLAALLGVNIPCVPSVHVKSSNVVTSATEDDVHVHDTEHSITLSHDNKECLTSSSLSDKTTVIQFPQINTADIAITAINDTTEYGKSEDFLTSHTVSFQVKNSYDFTSVTQDKDDDVHVHVHGDGNLDTSSHGSMNSVTSSSHLEKTIISQVPQINTADTIDDFVTSRAISFHVQNSYVGICATAVTETDVTSVANIGNYVHVHDNQQSLVLVGL
ncbi:hypothetical protein O3M35_005305 [Rhynocoris fuscipes]|uniref:Zinc finger protein n=1 Tax=Rhynocoris fuscipes TaxID=488301 RepID=A0AAW1DI92_9HEMI